MKRRDFLIATAGVAGAFPVMGLAQSRPCPPGTVAAAGGTSATTTCAPGSADADWLARIAGPGVVWYHDFDTPAEVNAFRWTAGFGSGNDPNATGSATAGLVRQITSDGLRGHCMEIMRLAGTTECSSTWWRPFSPIVGSGNGRGSDDPGANGTLAPQPYAATSGGNQINGWGTRGVYGHSSYRTTGYDGTEYYLQMRVKMDPRRAAAGMPPVGKLTYQTHTYRSLTSQELVTYSYGNGGNQGSGRNYFRMYGAWRAFYPLDQEVSPSDGIQPGSDVAADWYYSGGWDTIMYHVVMGRAGVDESVMEVFAAREGEKSFTRIWNQTFPFVEFEWSNGLNALICSTYNNGNSCPTDFWHRYGQIIFSKQPIACPQV